MIIVDVNTKGVIIMKAAQLKVEKKKSLVLKWWISTKTQRSLASVLFFVAALNLIPSKTMAAINVYFSSSAPTSLADTFLADVTTQYQAVVVPSKFQTGSYNVTINKKNPPAICGGTVQVPCDLDADLQLLVQQSTWNYVFGYGSGEADERERNLNTIGNYVMKCSTPTVFGASTTTFTMGFNCGKAGPLGGVQCASSTVRTTWDPGTCGTSLMSPMDDIFTQNYSTPTAIPGF